MGLQNFIGTKALGWVGQKTDGRKTTFTGIALILFGLVGMVGIMFKGSMPEGVSLPEMTFDEAMTYILSGCGILGIGGKLEKHKQAVVENTKTVERSINMGPDYTKRDD